MSKPAGCLLRSLSILPAFVFAAIALAVAAATSSAQTPPPPPPGAFNMPERYPWDTRPPKCLMPGAPKVTFGICAAVDNWPNPGQTIYRLRVLYVGENYALLERALTELTTPSRQFSNGAYTEEVIALAFTGAIQGSNAEAEEERRFAAWRKAAPDSPWVDFARASFLYQKAWAERGGDASLPVSKESMEMFNIDLQTAEQILLKASPRLRNSPEWYDLLLNISLDSDRVQSDPRDVFEEGVKRWPTYASLYTRMVWRMPPIWGGSWEAVEAFATKWTDRQPASEGKSLYARIYLSLLREASVTEMRFDWNRMKASFDDLIAKHPDRQYKNSYASFACFEKDKEAFGKAMRMLPQDEVVPGWWLQGYSYDGCVRWSGT